MTRAYSVQRPGILPWNQPRGVQIQRHPCSLAARGQTSPSACQNNLETYQFTNKYHVCFIDVVLIQGSADPVSCWPTLALVQVN